MQSHLARARLQVLGAAFLFSTGGAAIKAAQFTSWQVAGLRSGIAALTVTLLVPAARHVGSRSAFARSALVAVAYAATLVLFVLANKLTTAASTIFLQDTAPVYILLLSPLVLQEPIARRDLGFMVVIAIGMALFFVGRQASYVTAPDPIRGNVLALLSGLTYALMLLGLRWMGKTGGSPASAVALGNSFALLVALPMMLPLGHHDLRDWSIIVYLGVFQIGLAYYWLAHGIRELPAFEVALLLFLEPALNPLWAWLVHGEVPGPWAAVGGALILGATGLKAWWDSR
jgi:drug/metabolite transporter (DMT)-like permease